VDLSKKKFTLQFCLILSFLFLIFTCQGKAFCQIIKTFTADFSREYTEKNKKENIAGKIYYEASTKKLFIEVDKPVQQWMILSGNETLIYYPKEKQAFRILSPNPVFMPFFQAFIGAIKEDYGLSELGYTFVRHERKEKTLISHWIPPKNLARLAGEFVLIYTDNKLISAESKSANGALVGKSSYLNHVFYGGVYFPLEIQTTNYLRSGPTSEKVIYKNPQFNSPLPENIKGFELPSDVKVKVVEW